MLSHSVVERYIIVLHPATKWVKKKNWVLVAPLHKLFPGILKEKAMAIMQWVSNLEGINGIGFSFVGNGHNLLWGKSVLV